VLDERWTLRAGYSRNRGQIDSSRTVQNLLVPSINEEAWTAGLSWQVVPRSELNLGYELNPRATLTGTGVLRRMAPRSLTANVVVGQEPGVVIEELPLRAVPGQATFAPWSVSLYELPAR